MWIVSLLPAMPIVSALAMVALSPRWGRGVVRIATTTGVLTLALAVGLLGTQLRGHAEAVVSIGDSWGSLRVDPLGLLMAVVIALISLVVRVYSVRYMAEEDGYVRFFALLDVMVAVLLLMVTAADLITLLVAWHLIGVVLYFLLGQDLSSKPAHRYAFWTFLTYRLGDLPLVLAAVLLFREYGTWSLPEIFTRVQADPGAETIGGLPLVEVVGALVALAAFARSAQFLLHTWLPYTMEGPTPVSALMHAGIVNAGGFLINRFAPIYVNTADVLHYVFLVGLVTALAGSVLMLCQNDIKKQLGYSTMGQMGFMIMECGVGAFSLAIFHLIAHGLFKGTLFLGSGGVIAEARRHDGVPKDDMYTFVIEKQPQAPRYTAAVIGLSTVVVPLAVLGLTHYAVEPDVFAEQGAIILLFFGWVTGAQLFLSVYHVRTQNPWRLITVVVTSFVLVVFGYTLVSQAFAHLLYPDGFIPRLYAAAHIDLATLAALLLLVAVVALCGWGAAHWASRRSSRRGGASRWRISFYATLSREFYIADTYARANRLLLAASARLNTWLRWG
jgi:NADH-quinone oxidoreductase subunit L